MDSDARHYPTADSEGRLRPRDERMDERASVPKRPQSDLQRRLDSEQQMHHESLMQRRNGPPTELGEVDRELSMATGALEGLYQRIGTLASILGPVMPGGTVQKLLDDPGRTLPRDDFEINTEVGQRIRHLHMAISECEDVVGTLAANVRL